MAPTLKTNRLGMRAPSVSNLDTDRAFYAVSDITVWPVAETHMRDENIPARRIAERLGSIMVRREMFPNSVTGDVFALPRQVLA